MNILFTNAGRRTYLIDYALELRRHYPDIVIFVSDTSSETASMHVSPDIESFLTPRVDEGEEKYINTLFEYCLKHKIKTIVPLMDFELPVLAKNKDKFSAAGIKVWVSNFDTIMTCLNKKDNFEFCIRNNIPVPKSWFRKQNINFPIIRKKILGSGSVGLETIVPGQEFTFLENKDMLQQFVEGREIGMDILNDYNCNFVDACFREKILMRAGETDKAYSFFSEKLYEKAKALSHIFKHRGNMDVDVIETLEGELFFIDFNPRFGGGYPFTHNSGANYLKYIVEESMGINPEKPSFKNSITGMKGLKLYFYED